MSIRPVVRVLEPAGPWQGFAPKAIVYEVLLSLAASGVARYTAPALASAVGASVSTVGDAVRRLMDRGVLSRAWVPGQLVDGCPVHDYRVPFEVVRLVPHRLAPDQRPVSVFWFSSELEPGGPVGVVPVDRLPGYVQRVLGFVGALAGAGGALATSARIVARACSLTPGIAARALRELETSGHLRRLPGEGVGATAPGLVLYRFTGSTLAPASASALAQVPVSRASVALGGSGRIGRHPSAVGLVTVPSGGALAGSVDPVRSLSLVGRGGAEVLRPYEAVYEAHPLVVEAVSVPLVGVAA